MRRLVPGLVLTLVLTVAVLSPAAAATADVVATDALVLAAAEEGGEVGGLEPAEPNDPGNEFGPDPYEGNFLWGGAVGLLVLVGAGFAAAGGLYYLLVYRPNRDGASA